MIKADSQLPILRRVYEKSAKILIQLISATQVSSHYPDAGEPVPQYDPGKTLTRAIDEITRMLERLQQWSVSEAQNHSIELFWKE